MARLSISDIVRHRREGIVLVFLLDSFSAKSLSLFEQHKEEFKVVGSDEEELLEKYIEYAFLVMYVHTVEGYKDSTSLVPVTQSLGELELNFILIDELYEIEGKPHEYT